MTQSGVFKWNDYRALDDLPNGVDQFLPPIFIRQVATSYVGIVGRKLSEHRRRSKIIPKYTRSELKPDLGLRDPE